MEINEKFYVCQCVLSGEMGVFTDTSKTCEYCDCVHEVDHATMVAITNYIRKLQNHISNLETALEGIEK